MAVELEENIAVLITREMEVKTQRKKKATNVATEQTNKKTKPIKACKWHGTTEKPKSQVSHKPNC